MDELNEIKTAFDQHAGATEAAIKGLVDRLNDIEKKNNRPALFGGGSDEHEAKKAMQCYLRTGEDAELKAMSVGSGPDGGFAVVTPLAASITKRMLDLSPMRRLARVVQIESDAFEELADVGEAEAQWVGELSSRPDTDSPDLAKLRIPTHEIYAAPKATQTLIEDASIDIGNWLVDKVVEQFAYKEGAAYISGDGVGKPHGLLSYATATTSDAARPWGTLQYLVSGAAGGFVAPSATESPADCLVNLVHSLRAGYRPGASWLMNSASAGVIRKFKDPDGRFIWSDSLQAGEPPRLLGYPVEMDENMPDIAAGAYPIAFGNFRAGYTIVDRLSPTVLRDPFSSKPYVVFYTRKRVGAALHNSEAVKLLKIAA